MRARVEQLVEELIRPLVEADGGMVSVVEASDERVVLHLGGACAGCPGVHYTRAHVIVPLLRKTFGTRLEVVVTNHRTGPANP